MSPHISYYNGREKFDTRGAFLQLIIMNNFGCQLVFSLKSKKTELLWKGGNLD